MQMVEDIAMDMAMDEDEHVKIMNALLVPLVKVNAKFDSRMRLILMITIKMTKEEETDVALVTEHME